MVHMVANVVLGVCGAVLGLLVASDEKKMAGARSQES